MAKSKIIGSAPILLVKDVIRSANYYRDIVGFSYERFWGDPPCYGCREFGIQDMDGYDIAFGQDLEENIG